MIRLAVLGFLSVFYAHTAWAAPYTVDYANSRLAFSGEHAGTAFTGHFGSWQAEIDFDESALETSTIRATIDMASATTGDAMYDGTLPTQDWFDVAHHPQAIFVSESIERREQSYFAKGVLTLRGIAHPAELEFTLTPHAQGVEAQGQTQIDRLAYEIGKASDASAEWVSQTIAIRLQLVAVRG